MINNVSSSIKNILTHILIVLVILVFIFPIFWILSASFKISIDAISIPPKWFFVPTLNNYISIFTNETYLSYLKNSLVIGLGTVIISFIFALPAAYGFARFNFKGKKDLEFWILSLFMFPPIVMILPFLIIMKNLHLIDTYIGIILTHLTFGLPLAIWLLQSFIKEIPIEVEEAAMVDGAGILVRLTKIIIPLAAPGITASMTFVFLFSWNNFIYALILAPMEARTLPVATKNLISWAYVNWGEISAASVIIVFPILIALYLSRKYLVRGFSFGLK